MRERERRATTEYYKVALRIHPFYHFRTRTWGTINLPIGDYSLLFYVTTTDTLQRTFALDDITVTNCDYPPYQQTPDYALLSLSCDFDNETTCAMVNGDRFSKISFNFTLMTGDAVPNRDLGPTRDHTSNSSTGGFLYWNRQLPFTRTDSGRVHPANDILQNLGMCLRFAYYVNSTAVNKNATSLSVSVGGCMAAQLWSLSLDDSQGWQSAVVPMFGNPCAVTIYFDVWQSELVPVSVAFDDIEINQCRSFEPTTTTTLTTTTTVTSTTTVTISDSTTSTTVTTLVPTTSSTTVTTSVPKTSSTMDTTATLSTTTESTCNRRKRLRLLPR